MAYDRLLQLLTLSCSASVQMLQCGSELLSSLTELLSNSTGGWLQKCRLQSLFGWSWNSIFSAKSSNPLRFFKLSSSLCFIPPHPSIIRMLPNQSLPELCKIFIFKQLEKKNMRVILLRTTSNCVASPYHLLTQICWVGLLSIDTQQIGWI